MKLKIVARGANAAEAKAASKAQRINPQAEVPLISGTIRDSFRIRLAT